MKITAIKQQIKQPSRYSVFIDGRYMFSMSDSALIESKLAVGLEVDKPELKKLENLASDDKAYSNALRYVVYRMRSEWEVRQYLKRKKINGALSEEIINRLKSSDLINDEIFAGNWVTGRRNLKPISKRKLVVELKQKHVSEIFINKALNEDDTDESDVLKKLIETKLRQPKYREDKLKLLQYLSRHGYNYGSIKDALGEIEES